MTYKLVLGVKTKMNEKIFYKSSVISKIIKGVLSNVINQNNEKVLGLMFWKLSDLLVLQKMVL